MLKSYAFRLIALIVLCVIAVWALFMPMSISYSVEPADNGDIKYAGNVGTISSAGSSITSYVSSTIVIPSGNVGISDDSSKVNALNQNKSDMLSQLTNGVYADQQEQGLNIDIETLFRIIIVVRLVIAIACVIGVVLLARSLRKI